jgi:hypothetical protein
MTTTPEEIHAAVEQRFAQVARSPGQEKKFPVGPASAKKLGYESKEIDAMPPSVTESFCGVGNPLGLGEVLRVQTVTGGVKPTFLAQHGHEVINPLLPDEDFNEAIRIAQAEFAKHQPQVVVGSSRGGAVAMNINSGDALLVLLCPAWKKYGTVKTVKPSTVILHSRADDVIPLADSEELVRNSGLPAKALLEVGHDHRLADQEPLEMMLEVCSARS